MNDTASPASDPLSTPLTLIASADSAILDRGPRWFSLAREVVQEHIPSARIISFAEGQEQHGRGEEM
jgi:hypothetical protein